MIRIASLFWRVWNALRGYGFSWRDGTLMPWRGTCPYPLRHAFIKPLHKKYGTHTISRTQVLHVLRRGYVVEPAHMNIKGNWQCTLEALVAGDRIKVAAALMSETNGDWVVVITVMN